MNGLFLIIVFVLSSFFVQSQEKIISVEIDVKESSLLNLSEIAEQVTKVNLSTPESLSIFAIHKIISTEDFLFILAGSKENKGFPEYVLQFNLRGDFVKQIGLKNKKTGKITKAKGVFFDDNKIYVQHQNSYAVFNDKGVLLKSVKNEYSFDFIFNNSTWTRNVSFDFEKGVAKYEITKSDMSIANTLSVLNFEEELHPRQVKGKFKITSSMQYSNIDNTMYLVIDQSRTAYKIGKDNKLTPIAKFKLKNNVQPPYIMYHVKPRSFAFNDFVHFGYKSGRDWFIYLYNLKNGKGYNVKIAIDQNGQKTSGIQDDILNTGYVNLQTTNRKELIYFTKRKYDLPKMFNDSDDSDSVVFLVNLK